MTIRLRCPKCRKQNILVTTVYTDCRQYEVVGGVIKTSYITGEMPEHIRTDGQCEDCGHRWRVRDTLNGRWDEPDER